MIAVLAVETGITPSVLLAESDLFISAMFDVVNSRYKHK
ncbi:hypothetical protein UFOVP526_14 [uncultured Caudovirales phage]|uniref:Uncharacterized protein n=1 Tax=uncultured Caudovirales phage TaxID=2100421 RepID=A0A6J5MS05_9CAUD|nr:hypothetical protein UFOVP526_14 [uncultured Caudovirales phage]